MVFLRCSKCGSDSGFLIETRERKTLDIPGRLQIDRIKKSVLVTCMYCNNRWDHVPITLTDRNLEDSLQEKQERRLLQQH